MKIFTKINFLLLFFITTIRSSQEQVIPSQSVDKETNSNTQNLKSDRGALTKIKNLLKNHPNKVLRVTLHATYLSAMIRARHNLETHEEFVEKLIKAALIPSVLSGVIKKNNIAANKSFILDEQTLKNSFFKRVFYNALSADLTADLVNSLFEKFQPINIKTLGGNNPQKDSFINWIKVYKALTSAHNDLSDELAELKENITEEEAVNFFVTKIIAPATCFEQEINHPVGFLGALLAAAKLVKNKDGSYKINPEVTVKKFLGKHIGGKVVGKQLSNLLLPKSGPVATVAKPFLQEFVRSFFVEFLKGWEFPGKSKVFVTQNTEGNEDRDAVNNS